MILLEGKKIFQFQTVLLEWRQEILTPSFAEQWENLTIHIYKTKMESLCKDKNI